MNETIQVLINRRSIRHFNEQKVSEELLQQIVLAGQYAPNGRSLQAGKMLVVKDPELIEQLRRLNCTSVNMPYQHDNFLWWFHTNCGICRSSNSNLCV